MPGEKKFRRSYSLSQEPNNECEIGCKPSLFRSRMALTVSRQRQSILAAVPLRIERHDSYFTNGGIGTHLDLEVAVWSNHRFATRN